MNNDIAPGDRVTLDPMTDPAMIGDIYGTVRTVYRDRIIVNTDGGRRVGLFPQYVTKMPNHIVKG